MNLYDLAALLFFALLTVAGYRLGLVRSLLHICGFALAVFVSLRIEAPLGNAVARLLHTPAWVMQLVVFIALLGVIGVAVHVLSARLRPWLPAEPVLRRMGRVGGATLGMAIALLWVWLATGLLVLAPASATLTREAHQSSTAKFLAALTPAWPQGVLNYVGGVSVGPQRGQLLYELQRLVSGGGSGQLLGQEAQMLQLLNQTRRSLGLPTLSLDLELRSAATAHSVDMDVGNYFSHDSPRFGTPMDRMRASGVIAAYYGENISLSLDAAQAENAFMHSPGHRANILDPNYTRVGIGAVSDGLMVLFTQDFAGP
jgi:uncharacterized protein YkwD